MRRRSPLARRDLSTLPPLRVQHKAIWFRKSKLSDVTLFEPRLCEAHLQMVQPPPRARWKPAAWAQRNVAANPIRISERFGKKFALLAVGAVGACLLL
jgi:hypothetical protein